MAEKSRVLIRRAEYGDSTLEEAVEEAFDAFGVDAGGKRVLVKPNLLSARGAEKGVTTHPSVVSAVIAALEKRGAGEIWVGDNPGMRHYGDSDEVAAKTGILDAAGPYYRNLGTSPARVRMHNPYAGEVTISQEVLDCDVLISLPKFKTHSLTVLTGAVKNSYGFLLGAEKARLHRLAAGVEAFARTVVDVWALRRPDLVIVDAVTAMQGNGPSSRDVFHYGRVLASDDSVALDAVMAALMGIEEGMVTTTALAGERGLGAGEIDEIEIDGPFEPIEGFKLPASVAKGWVFRLAVKLVGRFAEALLVSEPHVDTNLCVRCGLCREHCPAEAIEMAPFPKISRRKCIRCYCCLEFCPHEALRLSRRVRFTRNLGR